VSVPQYQAQLQEQHQEGEGAASAPPATEGAPPPDGAGDDDIINDILKADKGAKDKRREPPPEPEDDAEPPAPRDAEEEPEAEEDEPEPAAEEDDIETDAGEEVTGDLAAARAALDDGDLDKACMIAFGKKPEDLLPNSYSWTKWRAANDRAQRNIQKLEREHQGNVAQFNHAAQQERIKIHNTIEALKPYEKYYHAEQAFAKDGDPSHLVAILEGIGKQPYNEIQKIILTKTRRSPTERALQERLDALEGKLQQTSAERERETQQQTQAQVYQSDLQHIRQNVTGPVAKIPHIAERIYKMILETRSAVGNTLTIEQAAERVARAERKRIAAHPFVKQKGKVPPAATAAGRTLAARAGNKNRPPLRRDSQNNGSRRPEEMTTDDIVADILKGKQPRRSA
jgi:hypothetical protein